MYGIRFLNRHSHEDFGVTIQTKEIGNPDKEKIKVKVPFSNVEYDFSQIYGSQTYTTRPLTYVFNVAEMVNFTKEKMNNIKTQLMNWLMNSNGKQRLYDDAYPGYYFLAEVEGNTSFVENWSVGTLTVTFTAYPFMISELQEGHDIWDDINFDLDILQPVEFTISGTLDITLYNAGTPNITPEIEATSPMEIIKEGVTYSLPSGRSKGSDFMLVSGENDLKINGNGKIKFLFYKELI